MDGEAEDSFEMNRSKIDLNTLPENALRDQCYSDKIDQTELEIIECVRDLVEAEINKRGFDRTNQNFQYLDFELFARDLIRQHACRH